MKISEYIEQRIRAQQDWYELKASRNKRLFMHLQTVVIVFGAVIPLLVIFEHITVAKGWASPASAVIAAIIAILAGIDKLRQPQANWFNYRANEELLKKEQWMHQFRAGPYRQVKETELDRLLVERVESIISTDIARFIQVENKEEEITEDSSSFQSTGVTIEEPAVDTSKDKEGS